jgi:hypothetical protein
MQKTKTLPATPLNVMRRYPRLTAHLICESLGYDTPHSAARSILDYIEKKPNFCEWYVHMAGGFNEEKLLKVGAETIKKSFQRRHFHYGFMAHYPQAKVLVDDVLAGGDGPTFASWF